jgi:type IV pilus assembly protein PilE
MNVTHGKTAGAARSSRQATGPSARGHTLLELLAALAIVASLATLATASYAHFTVAARRFDARAALAGLAAAQERHFLRYSSYAHRFTSADPRGSAGGLGVPDEPDVPGALPASDLSPQAYYALAIGDVAGTDYRLEARPRGAQARDRECAVFVLERSGLRYARDAAGEDTTRRCWAGA